MSLNSHSNFRARLVVFGAGYVGGAVALAAAARGWRVTALTRNAGRAVTLRDGGVETVEADLAGHVVDAVLMAPADLAKGEEGRIKKKRGVVVICENGSQSYGTVKALRAAGFDGAFSLKGGIGSWQRDNQLLVTGQR